MSSNNDFHLHFSSKSQTFDLDFQLQDTPSSESVLVNGKNYVIRGDEFNILWLKKKLPEIATSGLTFRQLENRLQILGAAEIDITRKVFETAVPLLTKSVSSKKGSWSLKQKTSLPDKRHSVANKYWEKNAFRFSKIAKTTKHIDRLKRQRDSAKRGKAGRSKRNSLTAQIEIHEKRLAELRKPDEMFLQFLKNCSNTPTLVQKTFLSAMKESNRNIFEKLFDDLSAEQLLSIDRGEGLNAIPPTQLTQKPVIVSKADLQDLQEYMQDTNFSGVVTISDAVGSHTISTSNIQHPQAPFAIHSVGKVFTGVLALRMIEEGAISKTALNEPIQLAKDVIEK